MVNLIINNEPLTTYGNDTIDTLANRVAMNLNTLPDYLWFVDGSQDNLLNGGTFMVKDMVQVMKTADSLTDLIQTTQSYFKAWMNHNSINEDDVILNTELTLTDFILYSDRFDRMPNHNKPINVIKSLIRLFVVQQLEAAGDEFRPFQILMLQGELGTFIDLDRTYDERRRIKQDLTSSIQTFKARVMDDDQQLREEDMVTTVMESSNFVVDRINFSFNIVVSESNGSPMDVNLYHFFNNLTGPNVLLSNLNSFFKINQSLFHTLSIKDEQKFVDSIRSRFDPSPNMDTINLILFRNRHLFMVQVKLENKNVLMVDFELNIDEDVNRAKEELKQLIVTSLPTTATIQMKKERELRIQGTYYIHNTYFYREMFVDAILNEPQFAIMYIDERHKLMARKNVLRANLHTIQTGMVKFNLSNHTPTNEDQLNLYGPHYVMVKILSITTREQVPLFRSKLNQLFGVYLNVVDRTIDYYGQYMDTSTITGKIVEATIEPHRRRRFGARTIELREMVPELFLPMYSRKCPKQPRIVSEEEAARLDAVALPGTKTMRFPIKGELDGQSHIYSCDKHHTHPYPGLRANNLANSDRFPFLPCCYVNNQEDRYGSPFRHYYFNEKLAKDLTDHEIYMTARILNNNSLGTLPPDIDKLVSSITNPDDTVRYYRYGTFRGPNSFIDCVLKALGDVNYSLTTTERNDYLSTFRPHFMNDKYVGVCKQEAYDMDPRTIKQWLGDPNLYLDPKRFFRVLEAYFNVSIILFERNVDNVRVHSIEPLELTLEPVKTKNGGELTIPYHSCIGPYMRSALQHQTIFILMHMGSEVDTPSIPHCELIIRTYGTKKDTTKNIVSGFELGSVEVTTISNLYDKLIFNFNHRQSLSAKLDQAMVWSGPKHNPTITINNINFKIVDQYVDQTGKTRQFKVMALSSLTERLNEQSSTAFTIVCEPTNPFLVPLTNHIECIPAPNHIVQTLGLKSGEAEDDVCYGNFMYGSIYGTKIKVLIDNHVKLQRDPQWVHYMKLKKFSDLLFEYMVIDLLRSNLTIESYFDERVVVMARHTYNDYNVGLNSRVDLFGQLVKRNGSIVLNSETLKDRVKYNLNLAIHRLSPKVKNELKKRIFLDAYFQDIGDFKVDKNHIIIYGYDTFLRMVDGSRQGELLLNTLEVFNGSKFFVNSNVDNGRLFTAQCFKSFEELSDQAYLYASGKGEAYLMDEDGQKITYGYIYLYDIVKGFEVHTFSVPLRVVIFKVYNDVFYIWLRAVDELSSNLF